MNRRKFILTALAAPIVPIVPRVAIPLHKIFFRVSYAPFVTVARWIPASKDIINAAKLLPVSAMRFK
tara:strand:- start:534 stop:734 length:201 start_codon:yes stop_codon:yes gene_type:complete